MNHLAFLTVDQMKDIGMSPLEIVLCFAVIALFAWVKSLFAANSRAREEWHGDTKERVDHLEGRLEKAEEHVQICEQDRVKLNIEKESLKREMETLKMVIQNYRACTADHCPIRKINPLPLNS